MFISAFIKEAFALGSGDHCFKCAGGYTFVSRHIVSDEFMKEMEEKGYEPVPYLEVLEIANAQKVQPDPLAINEKVLPKKAPVQSNKFAFREDPEVRGYMDEFPDGLTCGGL